MSLASTKFKKTASHTLLHGAKIQHAVPITTLTKDFLTTTSVTHKSTGQLFVLHWWVVHIKDQEHITRPWR